MADAPQEPAAPLSLRLSIPTAPAFRDIGTSLAAKFARTAGFSDDDAARLEILLEEPLDLRRDLLAPGLGRRDADFRHLARFGGRVLHGCEQEGEGSDGQQGEE